MAARAVARSGSDGCAGDAQRAELEKIIKRRVLANGLEVIVVENHGVPLATVEIDVRNGSFTQRPSTPGWRTCTSTCSSRRTSSCPSRMQFIDRAAELGAVVQRHEPRRSASTTT